MTCKALAPLVLILSGILTAETAIALPATDSDRDSIVDVFDNCPNVSNIDQRDRDGNGVGDLCEPRPDQGYCSAYGNGESAIALSSAGKLFLVEPETQETEIATVGDGEGVVANFVPRADAGGFDGLEVRSVSAVRNKLRWSDEAGRTVLSFGKPKDHMLSCRIFSSTASPAVISAHRLRIRRANGREFKMNLGDFGRLRAAKCADLNNDGRDELLLLTTRRPQAFGVQSLNAPQLLVYSIAAGNLSQATTVGKGTFALAVTDLDDNQIPEICLARRSAETSIVECPLRDRVFTVAIPTLIDLEGGNYFADARGFRSALAYLTAENDLGLILPNGSLRSLTMVQNGESLAVTSKLRFARCR